MKIFIYGISGSGKTTTSKFLAKKLKYKTIDPDDIFYQIYGTSEVIKI